MVTVTEFGTNGKTIKQQMSIEVSTRPPRTLKELLQVFILVAHLRLVSHQDPEGSDGSDETSELDGPSLEADVPPEADPSWVSSLMLPEVR